MLAEHKLFYWLLYFLLYLLQISNAVYKSQLIIGPFLLNL